MSSFHEAMGYIKAHLFTFEEFPLIERERFPRDCLKRAMDAGEARVDDYAASLKARELEGLLLDLVSAEDTDEINRAVRIIRLRISGRIIKLASILCQYHYDAPGIKLLCKEMANTIKAVNGDQVSFLGKFGSEEDKITALSKAVNEEGQDIDAVYKKYDISERSPMALEGYLDFLSNCDKTGCLINYKRIIILINNLSITDLTGTITNYLSSLALIENQDSVNSAILEKLGDPYISPYWQTYSTELRVKFAQWSYLYRLKSHCKGQEKKFELLVKYFNHVKTNYILTEEEVLITDFGLILVADVKGSAESYLYDKRLFDNEMAAWRQNSESLPAFLKRRANIPSDRDFMLSTVDAPCIKLSYQGIQRYYFDEVLDIKIGLEPDMRKYRIKRKD